MVQASAVGLITQIFIDERFFTIFSIKHGHVENKSNKLLYLSLTSPPPFNVDGGRFECNRATLIRERPADVV